MGNIIEGEKMNRVAEATKEQTPVKEETCGGCWHLVPGKKGRKCELTGKKRPGCMFACQYFDNHPIKAG